MTVTSVFGGNHGDGFQDPTARNVMSFKLPMGVATTYKIPRFTNIALILFCDSIRLIYPI